ncbi:MAG: hypothetical protein PHU64_03430 [Candidatus Omnitrophica bacterium]|nr:hypothetical protein [Candidatus Omnitrophota bacterium]MDD5430018.1 hypothetical protein [Candidatus Omnitrophota bacterium]
MAQNIALLAAVILPLWNIPLIVHIARRKSSRDISLAWAFGVWICLLLMAPSAFASEEPVWKVFNIANLSLFSLVVIFVVIYRKPRLEA